MWCHIRGDYAICGAGPPMESTCPLHGRCPLRGTVTLTPRAFSLDAVAFRVPSGPSGPHPVMYEAAVARHEHWVRVLMRMYKKTMSYKKHIVFVRKREADAYCRRQRRIYRWTCGLYGEQSPEVATSTLGGRRYVMGKF